MFVHYTKNYLFVFPNRARRSFDIKYIIWRYFGFVECISIFNIFIIQPFYIFFTIVSQNNQQLPLSFSQKAFRLDFFHSAFTRKILLSEHFNICNKILRTISDPWKW